MAKRSRFDGLDPALARIAEELESMPRAEFKETLKRDLQRKAETMATMAQKVNYIPAGYHSATAYLTVHDAAAAVEFYKRAFGATELFRLLEPSGRIGHAEIQVGDSRIMLADEYPEFEIYSPRHFGGTPVRIVLYVEDVDAMFAQAVAAGATVVRPVADQFYGARSGQAEDPFGYRWVLSTHIRDVSAEEMQAAMPVTPQKWLPEGFHSITPYLKVKGAARLMEFCKQAFGAVETLRVPGPDGTIMHASMQIADSMVELADGNEQYKPGEVGLHLYVPDADVVYRQALEAGATSLNAPRDQPYGDREAGVKDPAGNSWWIATHLGGGYMPAGMRAVTPFLHPKGAPQLIDFLQRAFGGVVASRDEGEEGIVHHAAVRIGDSMIEMGEAHGPYQPAPAALHLYVPNVDEVYRAALEAGAVSLFEPSDAPYGDRAAGVTDPFGNEWYLATHLGGGFTTEPSA
jgi:PhnB protein